MSKASHILLAIEALRDGAALDAPSCERLKASDAFEHQWASLAVHLLDVQDHLAHRDLLDFIRISHDSPLQRLWNLEKNVDTPVGDDLDRLLWATRRGQPLGAQPIANLINGFFAENVSPVDMSLWLALVCCYGLKNDDLESLTAVMTASGETHDYRTSEVLRGRRLLRRYPTGALSEKSALLLPALLAVFAEEYPLASPFMVARSLSFTGGTWDKLLSIPGFVFPHPGQEAIQVMSDCACAMVVSKDDCNPADRLLYQLRSATGTVRSIPLAAASIASKQLALPAHRLLLDVRYGQGAFFNEQEAHALAQTITALMEAGGIACDHIMTDTPQPGGSAIGNALEVMEALAIMKGCSDGWDERALLEQKHKCCQFFSRLLAAEFPEHDEAWWFRAGEKALEDGRASQAFVNILLAHGVTSETARSIVDKPSRLCPRWEERVIVKSESSGVLTSIDQRALGYLVNIEMGGGGNTYLNEPSRDCGLVLRKRLGDTIAQGETLLEIVPSEHLRVSEIKERCLACFHIEAELLGKERENTKG